jgi:hypothetical protein
MEADHACLLPGIFAAWLTFCLVGSTHADDQAECKPILGKAIKAMGGAAKFKQFNAGTWKVSLQVDKKEEKIICEGAWKGLNQFKIIIDEQCAKSRKTIMVINGENVWVNHEKDTEEPPKEMIPFVKNLLFPLRLPQMLANLEGQEFKLSPLGQQKFNDVEAVGFKISHRSTRMPSSFLIKTKVSLLDQRSWCRTPMPMT